jgi:hypothetical protein
MSETIETEVKRGPGRPPKEEAAQPQPAKFQRVIIQRPYGEIGSHIFIGFNDYERQVAYDVPIDLPVEVVNHLRSLRAVEHRADDTGRVMASYSNMLSVVDAPR